MRFATMTRPTKTGRMAMIRIPITRTSGFFPRGTMAGEGGGDAGPAGTVSCAVAAGYSA